MERIDEVPQGDRFRTAVEVDQHVPDEDAIEFRPGHRIEEVVPAEFAESGYGGLEPPCFPTLNGDEVTGEALRTDVFERLRPVGRGTCRLQSRLADVGADDL